MYCDEVLKATAEIRYHAGASVGAVGSRDGDGDWRVSGVYQDARVLIKITQGDENMALVEYWNGGARMNQ